MKNELPPLIKKDQIERISKLAGKHAEERARLEAEQHNARVALLERQKKELEGTGK